MTSAFGEREDNTVVACALMEGSVEANETPISPSGVVSGDSGLCTDLLVDGDELTNGDGIISYSFDEVTLGKGCP